MPKRKKLPFKENPNCQCGHPQDCHWKYDDAPGFGSCKHEGEDMRVVNNSMYCPCNKFVDMRYAKIAWDDPILKRFKKQHYTSQEDCRTYGHISAPTASRRFNLFKCLRLIKSAGFSADAFRVVEQFTFDSTRLKELEKLGVIV